MFFVYSWEFSVRDFLSWVHFINTTYPRLTLPETFYHGAYLVFLDGLGCNVQFAPSERSRLMALAEAHLQDLLKLNNCDSAEMDSSSWHFEVSECDNLCGIHPFYIEKGKMRYVKSSNLAHEYVFQVPMNANQ